jgi:flagellar hook protein FlgE
LVGGSVEESNTDISEEFSKLIITQQAYSANTKVLSTAQTMLQDVINIIR